MPREETEKWELPEALRITDPTVLAQSEAMRVDLAQRVNSPFARLSPQEQERARAAVMVDDLNRRLTYVDHQINEIEMVDGNDSQANKLQELREARIAISAQLAEMYAALGRFDLAAEVTPQLEARAEYVEILEAINRDDEAWDCQCAPGRDFIKKEVFSLKHNRMIPVRKCSGCEEMNAAALPEHLAEQRAHRAKARELVADKTTEEAKAALMAVGHTTERLIKR